MASNPVDNNINDAIKSLEKLKGNTESYAETWGDLGKKIRDSINPVNKINKQIEESQKRQLGLQTKIGDLEKKLLNNQAARELGINGLSDEENKLLDSGKKQLQTEIEIEKKKRIQQTLIKLAIENFKILLSYYNQYDSLLSENAKSQGTSKDEIHNQYNAVQTLNSSINSNKISNQEILAAVTSIRKNYDAIAADALVKIADGAATIARSTGLTVEESTKFYETMAEIGGTSLQSQENMEGIANLAAKAANVPLGKLIKDVANASAGVRLIFKGNTTELIKQAAELRKIGSSLDNAAKSAESLLNFESSIGSELKLSALLGQNINFNESRRLFFAGKVVDAEKALQRELERVGDLDKLNYFQRKALTEATGKDYSELQKIETQKKSLLEAERQHPELVEKRRKVEEELAKIQKSASEQRKEELALILKTQIAETQAKTIEQARAEVFNNIGRILKPVGDKITEVQLYILRFIGSITNVGNDFKKLGVLILASAATMYGAFLLIKKGAQASLNVISSGVGKAAESIGTGVGTGLTKASSGISRFGVALGKFPMSAIGKLAAIMVILTTSVMGIAYAFSLLGNTSVGQILAFSAALVILGTSLAIAGALMTGPHILGVYAFAGALVVLGVAAMEMGFAMKMAGPAIESIGKTLIVLASIVGGVIIKTFDTMLSVFQTLPDVITSVATSLVTIANIGFLKLSTAAAGIGSLSVSMKNLGESLLTFPSSQLTTIVSQLTLLSQAATGISIAANALKDLSGVNFPKIDMDFKGVDNLTKLSESKEKQTNELKEGLAVVAQKIENLASMMANGGIAVNLDGQLVSRQLSTTAYRSGGFGQSTTRS
jgi:hypothetical protein